jgi:succinoglycan biosynthesis transport protein ExoP
MTGTATATPRHTTPHRLSGELSNLVDLLKRCWRLIGLSVAVCLTLALIYLASAERLYLATARLLVLQQGSRPLTVASGDSGRLVEGADDFLPTHAVVIRSPLVVSKAIETVGIRNLPTLYRAQQEGRDPVGLAIDRLSVGRPDRSAKILRVDYVAGDREEAIRTVEAITDGYRDFLENNYRRNSNQVVNLISKARDELKGELQELERKYVEFRQKNMVLTTDESGRSFLTRRLDHWDRASNEAMVREVELKAQLELGRKLVEDGSGLWAVAYALSQLGGEAGGGLVAHAATVSQSNSSEYVRHLSQEQQQLAERYGPQYAKVKELQEQITRIQERMRDSRNRIDQVETRDLLASIEQSLKSIGTVRTEFAKRFDSDLGDAKKAEAELLIESNLRASVERQRALFNSVVDQLKQAQLTSDFISISSQTIEPANGLRSPFRPRPVMTLLLSLMAGCVIGVGSSLVSERLDSRIRSSEEVRKAFGYHLLGQIPQLPRMPGEAPTAAGLVSHAMPRSPSSEAYKMVRTNLELLRRNRRIQVIMVTSPNAGDGKSVTASNLAISLAHAGRRVLLVDADLRRPTQDWIHNLSRNRGLVHILRDLLPIHRVVQRSAIENLDVITAGPEAAGPAELLTSSRLGEFVEAARQSYDVVILDSPPLLAVTDPAIIGTLTDGVVLVVKDGSIRHRDAERVVDLLAAMGTPILGTVLNQIVVDKNGYTYGYGYGSGSGESAAVAVDAEGKASVLSGGPANGQPENHYSGESEPDGIGDDAV